MIRDGFLEKLLIEIYKFDKGRAKAEAKKQTFDQFATKSEELESIIGETAANEVIREGSFSGYTDSQLREYFGLAYKVAGILQNEIRKKPQNGWYFKFFYSTETLKQFLGTDNLRENEKRNNNYALLDPNNPNSTYYLSSLIENGFLIVKNNEHWTIGDNGVKGKKILRKIASELKLMTKKLGFEKPQLRIYYEQSKIIIDKETQSNLGTIRDMVYNN